MAKFKLSDSYVRNLPVGEKTTREMEGRGFGIRVLPSGTKTWIYAFTLQGKKKLLSLGNFCPNDPDNHVSADTAYKLYGAALKKVEKGINPIVSKSSAPEASKMSKAIPIEDLRPETMTVAQLAAAYCEHIEDTLVARSVRDNTRTLKVDVLPYLGSRIACEVRRVDAVALLKNKAKTAPGQSRNVLKTARAMWSYAQELEILEANPFAGTVKLVPQIKPKKRNRVLTDKEIKTVWKNLVKRQTHTKRILQISLLTGARVGEVAAMEWSELVWGMKQPLCKTCQARCAWWTIPGHKIKTENRRDNPDPKPFRVYLTPFTVSLLPKRLPKELGISHVFANGAEKSETTLVSSLSSAVRRMFSTWPLKFTPHDLRRTFSTRLPSLGCIQEYVDRITNHAIPGVGGVYNLYEYDPQKVEWSLTWSLALQDILATEDPAEEEEDGEDYDEYENV